MTKKKTRKQESLTREERIELMVQVIMKEGDRLGNDIIDRIELTEVDTVEMGIVAVGLAKAVAFAKGVADVTGINFNRLYLKQLISYREEFWGKFKRLKR